MTVGYPPRYRRHARRRVRRRRQTHRQRPYGSNIVVSPKPTPSSPTCTAQGGGTTTAQRGGSARIDRLPQRIRRQQHQDDLLGVQHHEFRAGTDHHASVTVRILTRRHMVQQTLHSPQANHRRRRQDGMRSWWKTSGRWPRRCGGRHDGSKAAARLGVRTGDTITLGKTGAHKPSPSSDNTRPATTTTTPSTRRPR